MGVRHMQGVPAHLEYVRKDKTDRRRYPTHCIYCEGKDRICSCPLGGYYLERCRSASRCDYYEEKDNDA